MATAYNLKTVTSGLMLCLDAANSKSYPGSGNAWYDISGNKNNFTLYNSPTYSTDNKGILTFNGTTQYALSTTTFPVQIANTDCTFRYVFYTTSTGAVDGMALLGSGSFNGGGLGMELRKRGTSYLEWTINDGVAPNGGIRTYITGPSNHTGVWVDVCVTYTKSSESKYYVNGVYGSNVSYSGETNPADTFSFYIGRGTDSYFPGSVSHVSFYNRALTSGEVNQNFQALRGRYGL